MIAEYQRTLKMPEAEEIFDLLVYRPLAFLFVKFIYRTPITPNQVTILSAIAGLVAAWMFSLGAATALIWGALWYAIANVLDCADGQLARLQQSGTLLGRVVDGVADYISGVAIFLGIGAGLAASGTSARWLVAAAGISSALHAMFFDHYQSEFISTVRAEQNFLEREVKQFSDEIEKLRQSGGSGFRIAILSVYVRYLGLQKFSSTKHSNAAIDPILYKMKNAMMIRFWSFLGPTTNRTLLISCALVGNVQVYLWCIIVAGNVWLLISYLLQRRIHRKLGSAASIIQETAIVK
ncbi:MAG: CDP-alcohol phosphatidyltransferase family protein [Ignavibacteriae bacterium]|nr:CDP-alcohol phosphatidyltransferase family protein [Ignavibacteria bacterium]MBI3365717.1 CDP-alcohol phosphatidyltransferase family protein [Ignavibacteriota bacterium]